MGLAGLDAALAGLRVSQQAIDVAANNIANASTPGFSRKIMPQSSQSIQGVTVGVLSNTIIRNVDLNLERDLWTQVSAVGFYDVQENYLSKIEQFNGPPSAEISVAAQVARLKDNFILLSDSPEDNFLLQQVVYQAEDTANKINDLAGLYTDLRNDAQTDIQIAVDQVNTLLTQIADFNSQVASNANLSRSTAVIEDGRDEAIKQLSEFIDISFFVRGDGVLVVQGPEGAILADNTAKQLTFTPAPVSATSFYPDSTSGIFIGDPITDPLNAVDITTLSPGGRIGALIELRDETLPKATAELDELAHKLALRIGQQGLSLFVDSTGTVPPDTPPDPTAGPPVQPVAYIGFSSRIQVNELILADNTLLQKGTVATDVPIQPGSNEVIGRVIDFAFGSVNYQQATGTIDLRASLAAGGPFTLQNYLGVFSENRVAGIRDISVPNFLDIPGLVTAANGLLDDPNDQFQITFEETRTVPALGPTTVNIDLSDANVNFPIGGAITDGLDQIIAEINSQIGLSGVDPGLAAVASRGINGEIIIESRGNITIDGSFAGGVGSDGLSVLGLAEGTYVTTDPSFDIQVGTDSTVTITIDPGDDENDLIDKLILDPFIANDTGVPGLSYDIATFVSTGELILRAGDDFANPAFGGGLKITSGNFSIDAASAQINVITPGTLSDGINLVSGIFGTFNAGPPIVDLAPITDVLHGSEVSATDATLVPFRKDFLGPAANISSSILGSSTLVDFAQRIVNVNAQEVRNAKEHKEDEIILRDVLQNQFLGESGVNIDEELANLIVLQQAFAASARVIGVVDQLFQEFLAALR